MSATDSPSLPVVHAATMPTAAGAGTHSSAAQSRALLWRQLMNAAHERVGQLPTELGLKANGLSPALWAALQQAHVTPAQKHQAGLLCLSRLGLQWPGVSAWRPRLHRLALMPSHEARRVLLSLALFARPSLLRRSLDSHRITLLRDLLGAETCDRITSMARSTVLDTNTGDALPFTPEVMAALGWQVVRAGSPTLDPQVAPFLKLLWRGRPKPRMPALTAAQSACAVSVCAEFWARIGTWIPEWQWLFGSELDAPNSASSTA